jgi:ABC-2 type transport system permease protein
MAAVTNFVIMPMTFLSGTFYLVEKLPEPFRTASHFNPFFYLIDGFRYGFIGHADGSIAIGVSMTGVLTVGLFLWCWRLFVTGLPPEELIRFCDPGDKTREFRGFANAVFTVR